MEALKARSRLVNFRLTQEEMENLRIACLLRGARNVSDFARSAVLGAVQTQMQPELQIHGRFSSIEVKLTEIDAQVREVVDLLRNTLQPRPKS